MRRLLLCASLMVALGVTTFAQAPAAAATCNVFKWYQACGPNSEQDCRTACGSCGMCLSVAQFNPCVYECRCSC